MTISRVVIATALVLGATDARVVSQTVPARTHQSYTSATTAILVDVVVRDRKGRPVTNLSLEDFSISEDGTPQKVDTFTRVSRGRGIGVGVAWKSPDTTVATVASADGTPVESRAPADEPTIALVFDHLSAETLRLAQRATLAYVPMSGEAGARVGVFATSPGIRILQPYTTDRSLVRNAVARVVPSGTSAQEQKEERADELTTRRRALRGENESAISGGMANTGPGLARTAAQVGEREAELRLIETELNMIRAFDNLDRDHRGYDTSGALLRVVQSLSLYPGRKTIVFFSEGLPASPALSARLDAVIEAANRANVTAYAVDAHGLRAKSSLTNMRKEVEMFAEERLVQLAQGTDRTEQPLTMAFERVEDTLKLDSRAGLARLAEDTGGFLVDHSNDLSSAFRRIDEDNQFHYLLTYSPANAEFDGKFRAIQVKVRPPGMQVFARKGYRAVRMSEGFDSAGYEIAALALLDRRPLPNAFPIRAAGFTFPDPQRPGLTPLLVTIGTDALRFDVDERRSTYSAQAAIVVRIRDGKGQEVQKVSQQYLIVGDAKDLAAAKKGTILFYRDPELPPGVYTMEAIVFDANAQVGSVRIATLSVPAADRSTLGMSSLVLVNRVEENATGATSNSAAPLYVGNTLLYPNLGEQIQRSANAELPFYFTLYGNLQNVRATAQLLRNGQPVAEAPVALFPPSGSRLQHVGRLPLGTLAAGTYELRIRVSDGRQELSRTAFFTLSD